MCSFTVLDFFSLTAQMKTNIAEKLVPQDFQRKKLTTEISAIYKLFTNCYGDDPHC